MTQNPYTTFVRSLTDAQLDTLYELVIMDDDLEIAVHNEYEQRERATQLTVYTPDLEKFRALLRSEDANGAHFVALTRQRLNEIRLLPGWSFDLEIAFRQIIFQLLEQLCH